jgi:hypothetical protein
MLAAAGFCRAIEIVAHVEHTFGTGRACSGRFSTIAAETQW